MSEQPPDPALLSSEQKDVLIRDLRRQLAALQPPKRELLDELREAPHKAVAAPPEAPVKLGRNLGLWRSPVTLGVVVAVMLAVREKGLEAYWVPSMPVSEATRPLSPSSSARRGCSSRIRR